MKTKQGILVIGLVAVQLLVLVSTSAYGQGRGRGRAMRGTFHMLSPRLAEAVGVTEEQQNQIQAIRETYRESFRTRRHQMREIRRDVALKLLSPGTVTVEDLAGQMEKLTALQNERRQAALKVALEIRGVLKEEQIAKAAEIREKVQALRAEIREVWRPNP